VLIGFVGQIHPATEKAYDLDETYVFQLDVAKLGTYAKSFNEYRPLPKFPAIGRDLAFVVDRQVPAAALTQLIREEAGEYLESVLLFDVYTGERIAPEKKSLAFSLTYRHPDRTLQDEEVQQATDHVVSVLAEKTGAELRS
jgi:phenylalanyl-tRNA synthetase beta chain